MYNVLFHMLFPPHTPTHTPHTGASGAEIKGVCTEAGMYALRERRVHVTQEDFEMAVAKVTIIYIFRFHLSVFTGNYEL